MKETGANEELLPIILVLKPKIAKFYKHFIEFSGELG